MSNVLDHKTVIALNRKLSVELWVMLETEFENDASDSEMDAAALHVLEEFGNEHINVNTHKVVWNPAFGGSYDIVAL